MTVQSINTMFYTLLFMFLIFSQPQERANILIAFISLNILFLISSLNSQHPFWEFQLESSKAGIAEGVLFLLIALVLSSQFFLYIALYRIAQSIITNLFFEIYKRLI